MQNGDWSEMSDRKWKEQIFTNGPPLHLGDLAAVEITRDLFWQPLTRRGRRRLRGGKTQPRVPRRIFVPCYLDGPAKIVRAAPLAQF